MKRPLMMCILVVCLALSVCLSSLPVFAGAGVTKNEIVVGMSTVLSGPTVFLGTSFRTGAEAYLNWFNEKGGVYGRKLRLIVYDDGYEPGRALVNANKLIKDDKVFCLFGNVGTPTAVAIKPILESEKVPLFAPFTGAEVLRNPVSRYIINYRASYNQETEEYVRGMADVLGFRKIAVFYQNDPYGMAVLNGTKAALEKRGLKPVATGTYTRNLEDVTAALDALMAAKPQAVVMGGTYSACAKFITSWKRKYFLAGQPKDLNPVFMNVSFVGPDRLAELLDKYGNNVVVTQVVPPFHTDAGNYPAVNEYLSLMNRHFPKVKPSLVGLEGFLAAKVFVEVLKRAGKEPTRESFIQAAESVRNLDIQAGNVISFSAENHQGSQTVYPTVIKDGNFQLITDWNIVTQQIVPKPIAAAMP